MEENKKIYVFVSEIEYDSEQYKNEINKLQNEENNIIVFVGGHMSAEVCLKEMLDNAKS